MFLFLSECVDITRIVFYILSIYFLIVDSLSINRVFPPVKLRERDVPSLPG